MLRDLKCFGDKGINPAKPTSRAVVGKILSTWLNGYVHSYGVSLLIIELLAAWSSVEVFAEVYLMPVDDSVCLEGILLGDEARLESKENGAAWLSHKHLLDFIAGGNDHRIKLGHEAYELNQKGNLTLSDWLNVDELPRNFWQEPAVFILPRLPDMGQGGEGGDEDEDKRNNHFKQEVLQYLRDIPEYDVAEAIRRLDNYVLQLRNWPRQLHAADSSDPDDDEPYFHVIARGGEEGVITLWRYILIHFDKEHLELFLFLWGRRIARVITKEEDDPLLQALRNQNLNNQRQ